MQNPESQKILLMESEIQSFGIGNTAKGIRNPNNNPSSRDKDWNPVPGIRNPQRGIQNPTLCWIIPLHGVKDEYLYSIYIYITWIFEPQALSSTNYFSMSILRGSVTAGDFVYRCQFSLEPGSTVGEKEKKIGEWSELRGSLRRGKCGATLSPSPGHPSARFLRQVFLFDPVFCLFPPTAEPGPGLRTVTLLHTIYHAITHFLVVLFTFLNFRWASWVILTCL